MIDIDRIARHRIDTEPSADLEARILARLDAEPAPRRRSIWPVWVTAGSVTAVAAVALVWGLTGGRSPESRVQSPESRSAQVLSPESRVPSPESTSATPAISDIADIAAISVTENVELSPEEQAWMNRRPEALPALDALRIDTLEYESIQPEALSIAPLIMTALPTENVGTERHD